MLHNDDRSKFKYIFNMTLSVPYGIKILQVEQEGQ